MRRWPCSNASLDEVDAALNTVQIDPAFADFVVAARARGMPVQVVSDGLDYAIRRILTAMASAICRCAPIACCTTARVAGGSIAACR